MSGCERGSCSPQNTEIKDPRASLDSWSPGLRAVAALSKTVCPSSTSALLPRPQLTRGSTLYTGTQKPHPANLRVCSKLIHRRVPAPQGPELASCPLPPPQSLQNLSSFSLLGQLAHFGSRLSPSLLPRCLTGLLRAGEKHRPGPSEGGDRDPGWKSLWRGCHRWGLEPARPPEMGRGLWPTHRPCTNPQPRETRSPTQQAFPRRHRGPRTQLRVNTLCPCPPGNLAVGEAR